MLSNQKLQNSLNEIKEISHMDTALFTAKGKLVAHTEEMPLPEALEQQVVVDFAESLAEKQTYQDYHLYKVMVEGETEYILVCLVKEESFLVCAQMAVCQIRNLVMSFAGGHDPSQRSGCPRHQRYTPHHRHAFYVLPDFRL